MPVVAVALALAGRAALAAEPPPAAAPLRPRPRAAVRRRRGPVTAVTSRRPRGRAAKRPLIHEAAPRPEAAVRVQQRFAVKANLVQLFGGAEYLSRGDFYNSPGLRVGGAYYVLESLGLELQLSHFWSSLDATAQQVKMTTGTLPDSHPPGWLVLVGGALLDRLRQADGRRPRRRHSLRAAGVRPRRHARQRRRRRPSADFGLGFLVFLMPRMFVRADVAVTLDWESRSGQTDTVWGTLPALSLGGML